MTVMLTIPIAVRAVSMLFNWIRRRGLPGHQRRVRHVYRAACLGAFCHVQPNSIRSPLDCEGRRRVGRVKTDHHRQQNSMSHTTFLVKKTVAAQTVKRLVSGAHAGAIDRALAALTEHFCDEQAVLDLASMRPHSWLTSSDCRMPIRTLGSANCAK